MSGARVHIWTLLSTFAKRLKWRYSGSQTIFLKHPLKGNISKGNLISHNCFCIYKNCKLELLYLRKTQKSKRFWFVKTADEKMSCDVRSMVHGGSWDVPPLRPRNTSRGIYRNQDRSLVSQGHQQLKFGSAKNLDRILYSWVPSKKNVAISILSEQLRIFWVFFWDSVDRDLSIPEVFYCLTILADFIWFFEVFAVLK